MAEIIDNTFTAYLGPEFQQRLMWQLLVEPEFAERTIPILAVEYFDDPNFKRLFLIILEYLKEYSKVPNLQNQSIEQAIHQYKTPNNIIEEESLFAVITRIKLWNERVLNQTLMHDGDIVQRATNTFIKQQEYRKIAEMIITKCKSGEMRNKRVVAEIEERFQKVSMIGDIEDNGIDVTEGLEKALRKEFRQTIPTGVDAIDALTGGGLGKGEMGLILTPSGVGKTTLLTKIANTARENNYNVLQIIFEDTIEQIQRKHVTIWTKIPLSELDGNNDVALKLANEHIAGLGAGRLTLKKFSQEDTTMRDVRDWILREQKKWNFKYDIIILDYLDCLESHKKTADRNEAELVIVKSFEAMISDFDVPGWSAIQSNRSGFEAEVVEAQQTGGSIKRVQKAHFFMSVAKTADQKEASLASIKIIKARMVKDGQIFRDCIFNNDTMEISIKDARYVGGYNLTNKKKIADDIIAESIEKHASGSAGLLNVAISGALLSPEVEKLRDAYMKEHKIEDIKPIENKVELIDKFRENEVIYTEKEPDFTVKEQEPLHEYMSAIEEPVYIVKDIIPVQPMSEPTGLQVLVEINEKMKIANENINELLDWTGETFTTAINENEVNLEDIKPKQEEIESKLIEIIPENVSKIKISVEEEQIIVKLAEEKLLVDPDEDSFAQKNLHNMLDQQRVNLNNIKKQ
jgi:replicative DNA helicase